VKDLDLTIVVLSQGTKNISFNKRCHLTNERLVNLTEDAAPVLPGQDTKLRAA